MDNQLNELLGELRALRLDMTLARAESAGRHLVVTREFGTLAECVIQLNERLDRLENGPGNGSGVSTAAAGVCEIAKAALLG